MNLIRQGTHFHFQTDLNERFCDYELLLDTLQKTDSEKYKTLHKGTPYYFLFWTAFDCRWYDKALFYLDAAISEDIKAHPQNWDYGCQSTNYLWLKSNDQNGRDARRVVEHTKKLLAHEWDRFNKISNQPAIDETSFVGNFAKKLVFDESSKPAKDRQTRTIVTAFYTFVAEFEERYNELVLRSKHLGSIELLLNHIFKGGLIFESLLKHLYPLHRHSNLGKIFRMVGNTDFGIRVDSSAQSLKKILSLTGKNDLATAFNVTTQLRNTTGHNLLWDDIFSDPNNFKLIFEQEMNAIFYIICRLTKLNGEPNHDSSQP